MDLAGTGLLDPSLPVTVAVCNSAYDVSSGRQGDKKKKDSDGQERDTEFAAEVAAWAKRPTWGHSGLGNLQCGIPYKDDDGSYRPENGPHGYDKEGKKTPPGTPEPNFPNSPNQNPHAPPSPGLLGM